MKSSSNKLTVSILQPRVQEGIEAREKLDLVNAGELKLSDREELELHIQIGTSLDSMKIAALLDDPERFKEHFGSMIR